MPGASSAGANWASPTAPCSATCATRPGTTTGSGSWSTRRGWNLAARSFGLDGERVELSYERFSEALLHDSGDPDAGGFLHLINSWMELTGVLNELSRSMGVHDFYPFVLSGLAVRKLHLVHRIVHSTGA